MHASIHLWLFLFIYDSISFSHLWLLQHGRSFEIAKSLAQFSSLAKDEHVHMHMHGPVCRLQLFHCSSLRHCLCAGWLRHCGTSRDDNLHHLNGDLHITLLEVGQRKCIYIKFQMESSRKQRKWLNLRLCLKSHTASISLYWLINIKHSVSGWVKELRSKVILHLWGQSPDIRTYRKDGTECGFHVCIFLLLHQCVFVIWTMQRFFLMFTSCDSASGEKEKKPPTVPTSLSLPPFIVIILHSCPPGHMNHVVVVVTMWWQPL